jgi:hypothetical protein
MGKKDKDIVSFSCATFDEKVPQVLAVAPSVNGIPLPQLVSEFERARHYEPAGGHGGIVPKWFNYGPLEKYFWGEYDECNYFKQLGAAYILGCECWEVGCWPLQCRIQAEGNEVVWDQFRQPHRDVRDYSEFGPFIFDGTQYRNALSELVAEMSSSA